jgi:hypothetical protein
MTWHGCAAEASGRDQAVGRRDDSSSQPSRRQSPNLEAAGSSSQKAEIGRGDLSAAAIPAAVNHLVNPQPSGPGNEDNQTAGPAASPLEGAASAGSDPGGLVSDPQAPLTWRITADGSPSLWSAAFQQSFHSGSGALSEAHTKYILPAQLDRFPPGSPLRVVEVCVGLGYNTGALLEAAADQGLVVEWWGLELDPQPLSLALLEPRFRWLWRPATLEALEHLRDWGHWGQRQELGLPMPGAGSHPPGAGPGLMSAAAPQPAIPQEPSSGCWCLGDARQLLQRLVPALRGRCDLVFLDAFSPGQCPQLWTQEFLGQLGSLLRPQGRLLTYCTAAAVRRGLELAGLELASLTPHGDPTGGEQPQLPDRRHWSDGTAASPTPLPTDGLLRPLSEMEREHLLSRAGVPYRDPLGNAAKPEVLEQRRREQQGDLNLGSTSAWRRRWGLGS